MNARLQLVFKRRIRPSLRGARSTELIGSESSHLRLQNNTLLLFQWQRFTNGDGREIYPMPFAGKLQESRALSNRKHAFSRLIDDGLHVLVVESENTRTTAESEPSKHRNRQRVFE